MMRRGLLIVLEGCDRCGKTTQTKLLFDRLNNNGSKVHAMQFPDRSTKVGEIISGYLKKEIKLEDHAIHLLFSANRWEMKEKMCELLNEGTTLIVDRYSSSGVAFSAAKDGMDIHWCLQPENGLLTPDLIIYLDVNPEVAKKRGCYGDEVYENVETQARVRDVYNKLMTNQWRVVDANRSVEEVHKDLMKIVEDLKLSKNLSE